MNADVARSLLVDLLGRVGAGGRPRRRRPGRDASGRDGSRFHGLPQPHDGAVRSDGDRCSRARLSPARIPRRVRRLPRWCRHRHPGLKRSQDQSGNHRIPHPARSLLAWPSVGPSDRSAEDQRPFRNRPRRPKLVGDGRSNRDPRWRDRRHADREPTAPRELGRRRCPSPSSTRTTATSTNRGCCSCRSAWRTARTSCGRGAVSCDDGIDFRRVGHRPRRHRRRQRPPRRRLASSPTTCWWSPPGAGLVPEETEGLTGPGWMDKVFTFYTPEGAAALGSGAGDLRPAVGSSSTSSTCRSSARSPRSSSASWPTGTSRARHPRPGPDHLRRRRSTARSPSRSPPNSSAACSPSEGIELVTEFNTGEVDGAGGRLVGYDGREVPFDLAVVVPLHGGAAYVGRSPGLGDELDFVPTDEHTLQSKAAAERLRDRRRRQRPGVEGRLGDPLRRRDPRRERAAATSPANRSRRASTGTPTASSRPGSTRRC